MPRLPASASPGLVLQRKCAPCAQNEEQQRLHRKATLGGPAGRLDNKALVEQALRGGEPLEPATRAYFEPRFEQDLGSVRIHRGATADASARAVNALAYTVGSDIVFRHGAFAPETTAGQELLAHELAHATQRATGVAPATSSAELTVTPADSPSEREADRVAAAVVRGERMGATSRAATPTSAAVLQRLAGPEDAAALAAALEVAAATAAPEAVAAGGMLKALNPLWGIAEGIGGAATTGAVAAGVALAFVGSAIESLLKPDQLRYPSEINPLTGTGYKSQVEWDEVQQLKQSGQFEAALEDAKHKKRKRERTPEIGPLIDPQTGEEVDSDPCDHAPVHTCTALGYPATGFNGLDASIKLAHPGATTNGTKPATKGYCFKDGQPRGPAEALANGASHTTYYDATGEKIGSVVCCNCCQQSPGLSVPSFPQRCILV